MGDPKQSEVHPSPKSITRKGSIAVTPSIDPVVSRKVTEREHFRRVSDTLEALQSNIDSHIRDMQVQRIDANDLDRPASVPLSSDSSSPSLVSVNEDQLVPFALYRSPRSMQRAPPNDDEETNRTASSSPDPFQLPIMQFEPRSITPTNPADEGMSESSEPRSFEAPIMLDTAFLEASPVPKAADMTPTLSSPEKVGLGTAVSLSPSTPTKATLQDFENIFSRYRDPTVTHRIAHGPLPVAPGGSLSPSTPTKATPQNVENVSSRYRDPTAPHRIAHGPSRVAPGMTTKTRPWDFFSNPDTHHSLSASVSSGKLIQAWPLRQKILVGIPIDQLRPIKSSTSPQNHRVPPWLALTEQGVLVRNQPPIQIDGTMTPISQAQWHPSQGPQSSTSAASPHTANCASCSMKINPSSSTSNSSSTDGSKNQSTPNLVTVPSTYSGPPVETISVEYQLAFIAPEDFPGSTTPSTLSSNSEFGQPSRPSRHTPAVNRCSDMRPRGNAMPPSSSSPVAPSSSPAKPTPGAITSLNLSGPSDP